MFRAELNAATLGAPGSGSLRAHTAGDGDRAAAQTEIDIAKFRRTALSLRVHEGREGGAPVFEGRLVGGGAPVAHEAVGLYADGQHVATLLTDDRGAFRHELVTRKARDGAQHEHRVQARFDSDTPWLLSSRSPVLSWKPAEPPAPSALWLLVPLLVCVAVTAFLLRGAPTRESAPQSVADRVGIHAGHGRSRGRAAQRSIGGSVLDAARLRPLPSARIAVEPTQADGRTSIELLSDARGHFESPAIADGHYRLTISVVGYATLSSELSIPHRGEWSEMQVQLQSLRDAAILAYKPAALRVLQPRTCGNAGPPARPSTTLRARAERVNHYNA